MQVLKSGKWKALILICGLWFFVPGMASGFLEDEKNQSSPVSGFQQEPDFLPVDQAYRYTLSVDQKKIIIIWDIAPGYYLYGDQFRFDLTANGKLMDTTIEAETGEVSWDEYLEKEAISLKDS